MDHKLKEMLDNRANLVGQMRSILDKADTEKRSLNADEVASYEKIEADVDQLDKDIELRQKHIARENKKFDIDTTGAAKNDGGDIDPETRKAKEVELRNAAFRQFIVSGATGMSQEQRALQADSDIYGGYIVAPQQFVADLIKAADNNTFFADLATVYNVPKAESLGAPSLDNDPADPAWTSEIGTGDEDSTMSFGKRELTPHPLAKRIKVSNKLLRASFMGAEALVQDRLGYKFRTVRENAFLNGTGANQPLGVFTASSTAGISTSRDVSTGNSTTSIKTDGLIEALYSLKEAYQSRATWLFHRDAIKQIRKLKDGEGQYIWAPGMIADRPNTILGRPYRMSEYAPNTFTNGLYVGIVGDFSHYWIVNALDMTIQRLVELYAATNQTGFIGRMETDGMPVLEEAFARVTLA